MLYQNMMLCLKGYVLVFLFVLFFCIIQLLRDRNQSEGICQGNADSSFLLKFVFSNVKLYKRKCLLNDFVSFLFAKTFQDIRKYVHGANLTDILQIGRAHV